MKKKRLIRRLQKELNRQATISARRRSVLLRITYDNYSTKYCAYCHRQFPEHQKDCLVESVLED